MMTPEAWKGDSLCALTSRRIGEKRVVIQVEDLGEDIGDC